MAFADRLDVPAREAEIAQYDPNIPTALIQKANDEGRSILAQSAFGRAAGVRQTGGPDHREQEGRMTVFNIETLNALGARLFDHADSITNVVRHDMEVDVRLAARVCRNMATLRFRISEIAEQAMTQPGAAVRRDLIAALADAEF